MTTSPFELEPQPEQETEPQDQNPIVSTPPALPFMAGQVSRFRFFGTASEYFGIWFVNLLLTIVTLTLYSPWAKVRRLRYFYSHTEVADARFDFTGEARAIFFGRLIALVLYFAMQSGRLFQGAHLQWLSGLAVIVLYLAIPYLLRATYRFMSRNSIYRNSRFYFTGSLGQAFLVYLGIGFLTVLSFGLLIPYYIYRHKHYEFNNLQIGQVKFQYDGKVGDFYKALWPIILLIIAFVVFVGIIGAMLFLKSKDPSQGITALVVAYFSMFFLFGVVAWYTSARIYQLTWSKLRLGNSVFTTDLRVGRYIWIAFSNFLAKVFSFGLLTPWAVIRLYQYKIESLSITWHDDPNELLTSAQADLSAFGEELSDIIGIDLSL